MKKTLIAGLVGFLAAVTFAGKDNVVVTFYTTGPDAYADGSTVLDGETYALVYTPKGSTFRGFSADGSAIGDSKVALKAPIAKDGKCPFVKFEIDEGYAKANYADGSWGVYLLDTRLFAAEPGVDGQPMATGAFGKAVNGYGAVATATGSGFLSASASESAEAGLTPADRKDVKITGIRLIDGKVYIHVSGTVSSQSYQVQSGATPDAIAPDATAIGNTAGEMIIIRDQVPGGAFFKVNRR